MKRIGIVVAIPHKRSCIVLIKIMKYHYKYKTNYFSFKRYYVHDERTIAKLNTTVLIRSTKPISRKKNFILLKVLD